MDFLNNLMFIVAKTLFVINRFSKPSTSDKLGLKGGRDGIHSKRVRVDDPLIMQNHDGLVTSEYKLVG